MTNFISIVFLSCFVGHAIAQKSAKVSGCSNECGDAHRICPAIKDASFYDKYAAKHAAGELGQFSKAPLPPKPNCADEFYKVGCRQSCGLCTPCHVDAAAVDKIVEEKHDELEAKLVAEIEELQKRPVSCNACTQILGKTANGEAACLPKYHTEYEEEGKCSCDCGPGQQRLEKVCYSYEKKNGKCKRVKTFAQNCPQGPDTKTKKCNSGSCTVTRIIESTSNKNYADSKDTLTYKAYTASGKVCDLGKVEKADGTKRQKNKKNTYSKSEIENPVCKDICLKKNEKFEYIKVTTSGEDGWLAKSIQVKVNGENKTYKNDKWLDDRETLKFV